MYWTIYKNLEKEIIGLTNSIHFCDEQKNVFSMKIAELIVRCAMEIESIFHELYESKIDGDIPEDKIGQRINAVNNEFNLEEKQVKLVSTDMYFREIKTIKPFMGEAWYYDHYNAVKHYRGKNFNKATVEVLINAMAALYILNLYHTYKKHYHFTQGKEKFDYTFGSVMFEANHRRIDFGLGVWKCDYATIHETAIFLEVPTQKTINNVKELFYKQKERQLPIVLKSPAYKKFIETNKEYSIEGKEAEQIAKEIGAYEGFVALISLDSIKLQLAYNAAPSVELNIGQYSHFLKSK